MEEKQLGSICIDLPLPISVNKAYAGFARRHKSKDYNDWIAKANRAMDGYPSYSIEGDEWLSVEYLFHFPLFYKNGKKRKQDAFNYEKVLSDYLATRIGGFEDHKIIKGIVRKLDSPEKYVTITIHESLEEHS